MRTLVGVLLCCPEFVDKSDIVDGYCCVRTSHATKSTVANEVDGLACYPMGVEYVAGRREKLKVGGMVKGSH